MMTNRELVLNAFQNKEVERVPVGFWFHFLPDEDSADALADPSLARRSIEGHRSFIKEFHPDFVKIMSDGFFRYPIRGGQEVDCVNDLSRLAPLDASDPWIERQVDLAGQVIAMQKDTLYFYNIFSPLSSLRFLIGPDALLRYMETDAAAVAGALEMIGEGLATLARSVIRGGRVDGIYYSVQNPDINRISDDMYRNYIAPGDKIVLSTANEAGGNNILHICGYAGVKNHLNTYADYPAAAYNWAVNVENVSLAEGKRLFGGRTVIGGFANTPGSLIETGDREQIEAFTLALLEDAGKTGVIIGADCTVPRGISLKRLEWVRKAASSI